MARLPQEGVCGMRVGHYLMPGEIIRGNMTHHAGQRNGFSLPRGVDSRAGLPSFKSRLLLFLTVGK